MSRDEKVNVNSQFSSESKRDEIKSWKGEILGDTNEDGRLKTVDVIWTLLPFDPSEFYNFIYLKKSGKFYLLQENDVCIISFYFTATLGKAHEKTMSK